MQVGYNIFLGVGLLVALAFSLLVYFTGKGDAMGGSTGVRTTFKGKAGFDDYMSRLTLILGISFMAVMLLLDIMASRLPKLFS